MASPATGTLPQQTVLQDRYVVMQKLGQGGMGAVYRAGDRRLSTVNWAVKEMSQSAISGPLDDRVRDRIVAETRGNPLALLELPRGLTPAELAGGFGLPHAPPLAGRIEDSFQRRLASQTAERQHCLCRRCCRKH